MFVVKFLSENYCMKYTITESWLFSFVLVDNFDRDLLHIWNGPIHFIAHK